MAKPHVGPQTPGLVLRHHIDDCCAPFGEVDFRAQGLSAPRQRQQTGDLVGDGLDRLFPPLQEAIEPGA